MQYDSFNVSLCAGLLPQGGFLYLFGDGSLQKQWQWAAVHPRPVCDVLLVSSCFRVIEVNVTSTPPCPEAVDVDWRDNLPPNPLAFGYVHFFLGAFCLLLQTGKAVTGFLQVRFLFKAHGTIVRPRHCRICPTV